MEGGGEDEKSVWYFRVVLDGAEVEREGESFGTVEGCRRSRLRILQSEGEGFPEGIAGREVRDAGSMRRRLPLVRRPFWLDFYRLKMQFSELRCWPLALELEEERRNEQEQLIRDYDLWDDTAKSNEILAKLADSVRVVDALRDLTYKGAPLGIRTIVPLAVSAIAITTHDFHSQAEEAKLITQLAEIDVVNYGLFRQAYDAYLDMSKILNKYEISKPLKGPYDMEGACLIIKAGGKGYSEERQVCTTS